MTKKCVNYYADCSNCGQAIYYWQTHIEKRVVEYGETVKSIKHCLACHTMIRMIGPKKKTMSESTAPS